MVILYYLCNEWSYYIHNRLVLQGNLDIMADS